MDVPLMDAPLADVPLWDARLMAGRLVARRLMAGPFRSVPLHRTEAADRMTAASSKRRMNSPWLNHGWSVAGFPALAKGSPSKSPRRGARAPHPGRAASVPRV